MSNDVVLVTGSSGKIGRAVVAELQSLGIPMRGFDRSATPGLADMVIGDLLDRAALERAMVGVETLIHLAATPDDDDFLQSLLPNNITGVFHVMEAARLAGVRRLILASSGQVVWWQRQHGPLPITPDAHPSPRYWYAATKAFLEAIGRGFAETHGMTVVAVRLGWCPRPGQEADIAATPWAHDVYLSPGDAGRFFAKAVTAPLPAPYFGIFHACSKPVQRVVMEMSKSRDVLGFNPIDTYPTGMELPASS